ncbi:TetR family transcriptional regulator [Sneathiella sp. P13V-1]|uniref:TetR/AcrR family transcriptional regulator n=1 Tax=Sneathiella sp. P13V-1 TaxID=2697366 RepID=UPI00187BB489|nr:TetR/AcrR family transcriptional regulator [Sneathiella sp. P13V-1]MBE7638291.1 TetR family transcriptional regulator [Sneathiella sp. P13V-1]
MTEAKRKRRSAKETRSLIVQTAVKELVSGGGTLEMAALAKKAGLSEGLAYHYFGNRGGVVAAVVDDFYDRFEERVIDIRFEGEAWQQREEKRVSALIDFYFEEPLTPIIFNSLGSEAEVIEVEARRFKRQIDLAEQNIRDAQETGDIPDERDARMLGAMMLGAIRWGVMANLEISKDLDRTHLKTEIWMAVKAMSTSVK